jgi:hypothetical protein
MISIYTVVFMLVANITLYLYFGIHYRTLNGGFLPFKEAFALIFFISVISTIINGLFYILLTHVINPELPQTLQEAIVQKTIGWMQRFGAPQDKIDEAIAKMQSEPGKFTVIDQLRQIVLNFIGSALLALILGAIIKKNPPPFENITDQNIQ